MKTGNSNAVIKIHRQGPPEVMSYEYEALRQPGTGEVTIKQEAIGVNFVDTMFRSGVFPLSHFPSGIGVEAAGTIESVGNNVGELKPGDRVVYHFALGAYAEKRTLPDSGLVKLPGYISGEEAAMVHAKGLTARMLVKQAYEIKPGDTILVHAAAGAVGSLLSRWAKSIGARVIGTVGTETKKALLTDLDAVIVPDREDIVKEVKKITGGEKVDALYDGVGQATFNKSLEVIRPGGHAILYGGASGYPAVRQDLLNEHNIRFIKPDLGSFIRSAEQLTDFANEVFNVYRNGIFGNLMPTRFKLEDAVDAHKKLEGRLTTGPVLLIP